MLINLLNNTDLSFTKRKYFIFSALNMALITAIIDKNLIINDSYIFWPDGLGATLAIPSLKKIPGRVYLNLMLNREIENNINFKKTLFIGSKSVKCIDYLDSIQINYEFLDVPFANVDDLFIYCKSHIVRFEDIVLLIPTPKQEMLAEKFLTLHSARYFCFGGALNMLAGVENPCPNFISKLHLESLWRLRTDPLRRLKRIYKFSINIINIKRLNINANYI